MQFNIIYTPYTVRPLNLFLISLIHNTSVQLRLVSNACPPEEVALLHGLADLAPDRVSVMVHPTSEMLPHPVLLNELQEMETGETFAFMDSDILALGDIQPFLADLLQENAAVFSGISRVGRQPRSSNDRAKAGGRFMITEDGFCLGGTYFAIYRNVEITRIRKETGISFNNYDWAAIPSEIQGIIRQMGIQKERYDNGKVLNILLQHAGHRCTYTEDGPILHYGGLSRFLTVLNRKEEAMAYHKAHRSGQENMRLQAEYLASALQAIQQDQPIPDMGPWISGSDHAQIIRQSLDQCIQLRQHYRTALQQIGL